MHSCVTSKNAKWCHLIWPTLYRWLTVWSPTVGQTRVLWSSSKIVHAAATTTSSDIIISCLHFYSFPAYFQSRDYCDADTVDFCRLRFCRSCGRLQVDSQSTRSILSTAPMRTRLKRAVGDLSRIWNFF